MMFKGLAALTTLALAITLPAAGQTSLSRAVDNIDQKAQPQSFRELSSRLMPAVVNISTSQTIAPNGMPTFPDGSPMERFNDFFGRDDDGFQREGSLGSGFVISADGLIITNNHVIENADEIDVNFSNGRVLKAELIGRDPDTDLAVLKVNSATPLPFVDLGNSDNAEVGDWVIAIGNPFGFGGSVSAGIISARNRDIGSGRSDDFIQTDAAINRGNSGGPLFNLGGEVVGVNTAIISPTGGSVGIGFSVPANLVRRITDQLRATGKVRRGWLGVNVQDADKALVQAYNSNANGGVIITRITEDGPAAESDLEIGDLLLTFDGEPIESVRDLTRRVAETAIGKEVSIALVRDGRGRTADVKLGELDLGDDETRRDPLTEAPVSSNDLGAELAAIDDDARRRHGIPKDVDGVLISSVSPRGPAFGKLQRGDVIVEIEFEPVVTVSGAIEKVTEAIETPNKPLLVRVKRRGGEGWYDQFFPIDLTG